MIARRLPWLLLALGLVACQGLPTVTTGRPHIVGGPLKSSPARTPTPAPTASAPAKTPSPSGSPLPSIEPPPVPVQPPVAGGGGTGGGGTTPTAPTGSPVLGLVAGTQPADTWQTGVPLRRARAGLVAAALGDRLVALEGTHAPSLETYERGAPAWQLDDRHDMAKTEDLARSLQHGRSFQTLGVSADSLYAAGGGNGVRLIGGVTRYGEAGCQGEVPLFSSAAKAAAGGMVGDILVMAGGLLTAGNVTSLVQRADLVTTTATIGSAMPVGVAGAASVVLNGKIYILGGYTLDTAGVATPKTAIQVYDVAANTWRHNGDVLASPPAALPAARHSAAAGVLGGKIYLSGGVGTDGQPIAAIAIYDPAARTWTTGAPMLTPRSLHAFAAFQGRLWALGGFDAAGRMLTGVEIYQP